MLRINGFPLYQLGLAIGQIVEAMSQVTTLRADVVRKLAEGRPYVQFTAEQSYLPHRSKESAQSLLATIDNIVNATGVAELPALTPTEQGLLVGVILQLYTTLAQDLARFDLYWIEPKLGYSTAELMADATIVFPESIRAALSAPVKYEIQEAANCLLYDASSAVGFHVLRAIEIVVLDYFSLPAWTGDSPTTWSEYSRDLKKLNVHPKIREMVSRLANLHRNELMHADAVLSKDEAAILFHLMQEALPIMIADVAKRKGNPIVDFPILNDPRWQ